MSDSESSPLLSSAPDHRTDASLESTPLLSSAVQGSSYTEERGDAISNSSIQGSSSSPGATKKPSRRWPSIVAISVLGLIAIAIMLIAFFVPAAVEEYAKEAVVLEPTNLSLESITADGVRARIQANVRLDGTRVRDENVRRVGRFVTWVVRQLGTEQTTVHVYLPEYGNIMLGTATLPPMAINIMDGQNNAVDFVAYLVPGNADGIRTIANEWLEGRLDRVRVRGNADIELKSGIIPLGTHAVSESLVFEAKNIPDLPHYDITRLNFREAPGPDEKAMAADVSISAYNKFPVQLDIPELGFDILVSDCNLQDPLILLADAVTGPVAVRPRSDVLVGVHGLIRELPASLTRACPNSNSSPLDMLLKQYMTGEAATIFVRGNRGSGADTPKWISDLLSSVIVPVPFPGRTFDSLIRNFSLTDVHFTLPDPLAEPGDPDGDPMISGTIQVLAALPSEMNFSLDVTDIRANSDVFYHKSKLGELNVRRWQPANSTRVQPSGDEQAMLKIGSRIKKAPLNVTDGDVFTEVVSALLFGGKEIILRVDAAVDVRIQTVLGTLVLKDVPAEGRIPVKPLPNNVSSGDLTPKVGGIKVLRTSTTAISIQALVNITNPSPYTASIPYANVHILHNDSLIGEATVENVEVGLGNNSNILVKALWDPNLGGHKGREIGRNLLSQYISGYNTSLTLRTHRNSIPAQPIIGEALAKFNLTVPAPCLNVPGHSDADRSHFIRDATFHVLSSTATFTLLSPLRDNTLYIDYINATAIYNHTEPVGNIEYDLPFAAPPGESQTPRLPVDWSLGSVGYQKLKDALGGRLKLDAKAVVNLRLGNWKEEVWFVGRGIGANVRV